MKALTDEESDAMQMTLPVLRPRHAQDRGLRRRDPARQETGHGRRSACRPSGSINESRLEVRYSPTLAGAMVDALPYLVDYPYGCTEQTLNRFLPTVITQKILLDMKLDLKDDPEEAHQPQRPGDRRRQGAGQGLEALSSATRSSTRPRSQRWSATGIKRLADMQLSDGGWGWFSG